MSGVAQISQSVLNAVYTRLSDPEFGYNPGMQAQAPVYGLALPAYGTPTNWGLLDFSPTSQTFYFDQIDSEALERSGTIQYPFACLYVLESQETNTVKFTKVSGLIRCIFEVNLSFIGVRGIQNREVYSNCIEDVVLDIINRENNQNWPFPLVYNGMFHCKRGPTVFGAQHWKKKIGFSLMFGYDN
jgi:hypothetical protein